MFQAYTIDIATYLSNKFLLYCLIYLILPKPRHLKLAIAKTPKEPLHHLEGKDSRPCLPANLKITH